MRLLSLFSGIGAFEKALNNIGVEYELVGFSEVDKWAIESYCAIHDVDKSLNLGDISKVQMDNIPNCDLITYGFPCQDISIAGNQQGIKKETRSGLLYEAEKIISYIKPKYAIAENVKNLIGKRHRKDFDKLLERLDSYGYNNYWQVLNAKDYGIPQNRERVFIVSIRKDIDKGYEFPKSFDSGLRLKDFLEDKVEEKYYIDNERTNILLNNLKDKEMMPGGINVSKQGKVFDGSTEIASCLLARDYKGLGNQSMTAVAEPNRLGGLYDKDGEKRQAGAVWDKESIGPTLDTMQGGHREPLIVNDYRIRKLTPKECWRLMGFTHEDYYKARVALEDRFYNGKDRSNSQMYKQAGNSIVVNVLEEIFKKLFLGEG